VPHANFVKREITKNESHIFYFGTIACFKPQKNIFDLLHAFAHVHEHDPHTHLEIIGDGYLREEIENYIIAHKLDLAISLHGWQEDVSSIMQRWHAFVLTSLWEGLPCAIVEARLLKIPVISYKTGGIGDVITHHQNGLLFDQYDWRGVAQAMLELTHDKKLYAGLSSFHDDLTEFDINSMWKAHQKLYRRLGSK
jgi:glycosyltransferase involved in cell wall biosynthesis